MLASFARESLPCAGGASRRGPVRGCRNSFAGLVMLPGLVVRRSCDDSLRDGREANDAKLSQTADNPGPDRAGSLEAGRLAGGNELEVTHANRITSQGSE